MQSVKEIDFQALTKDKTFYASPTSWGDKVLYFLLLDRFSDGNEKCSQGNTGAPAPKGKTPLYQAGDNGNAVANEADAVMWRNAGGNWNGGTLKGLTSKMGYLSRLGVSALWVSPLFKQVPRENTYHGYGIQDFLDVEPNFGNLADLREMVATAHEHGIHVILDIVLNHTGNVFSYAPDRYRMNNGGMDVRFDGRLYPVQGFNDAHGAATIPFQDLSNGTHPLGPDDAVWPRELQNPACFTQKGEIRNWDNYPEYLDGDFFNLKNVYHGSGTDSNYTPSPALQALCQVYKYWIAAVDIDGYRIDTVKHMEIGAMRFFISSIKEFALVVGKENFLLVGEITGGREMAVHILDETGLDAALGIDELQPALEGVVKGESTPATFFNLFRNSLLVGKDSHLWFKDKVVTMINDHDQVCKGQHKARFCADSDGATLILAALALNATTLGIPCIYYGTEQLFDGSGDGDGADRYIRESMFGGQFGAFRTKGRHFFDEDGYVYRELAKILKLREERLVLRRGRQYLREISGDGIGFGLPQKLGRRLQSVVAWSRILDGMEMVVAINTDPVNPRTAWVLVDSSVHPPGSRFSCVYSTDPAQITGETSVQSKGAGGGIAAIQLSVPAAGFVMWG